MAHHDNLRKEFVTIDSLQLCLDNLKTDILSSLKLCASAETVQISPLPTTMENPPHEPSLLSPPIPSAPPLLPTAPTHSQVDARTGDTSAANTLPSLPSLPSLASVVSGKGGTGPTRQQRPPNGSRATSQVRDRSKSRNRATSTVYVGNKVASGQISFKGADLTVDRYVGHIDVNADNDEVKAYIENSGVRLIDFQENPRTHSSFKSFKITARRSDLPMLERDDFWPTGVVFRNFFRPRQRRDTSAAATAFTSSSNGQS